MSDALDERQLLTAGDVGALTDFADRVLPSLQQPDGLFCFDRTWADPTLRGTSVRYSIMVLIGLARREAHGGSTSVDVGALRRRIHRERATLGVGDLGLLLWADIRLDDRAAAAATLALLDERATRTGALTDLEGMEIGWLVCGAVAGYGAGLRARRVLCRATDELHRRRASGSSLFRHTGAMRGRALLPNFATQIYGLLALTELMRHGVDPTAESHAIALADELIGHQRDDGGWPWIYHAEHGAVVEPYEVYSVHQDAMAPMALLAMEELVGGGGYRAAAERGLLWCFGHNELSFNFYDTTIGFAHRSIRRRGPTAKLDLWTNAALVPTFGERTRIDVGGREINPTCRPYHLGWILEAWSR